MIPQLNINMPLLSEFINTRQSEKTKEAYRADLVLFKTWLNQRGIPIPELKPADIMLYRAWLASKCSKLSVNRRLATVKSYIRFCVSNGVLERNAAESVNGMPQDEYTATVAASNGEVCSMLECIDLNTSTGLMHSALLHCLFYLGLRREECIRLKVSDLSLDGTTSIVTVNGKGNKRRTLPLPVEVINSLKKYLYARSKGEGIEPNEPIFVSTASNRKEIVALSPSSIAKIVRTYKTKAGIEKRITPHSARATAVTNALENGATVIQVQAMGGWSSLDMVLRYEKRRTLLKNSAVFAVNYKK